MPTKAKKQYNKRADTDLPTSRVRSSNKKPASTKAPAKTPSAKKPLPLEVAKVDQDTPSDAISLELQQQILSTFQDALLPVIAATTDGTGKDLKTVIQEVKTHLYNRDFTAAFGREDYLHAYALRWSSSRALGYAGIVSGEDVVAALIEGRDTDADDVHEDEGQAGTEDGKGRAVGLQMKRKIVCIGGGGGAEVMAFAALREHVDLYFSLDVHPVDIADWTSVFDRLNQNLATFSDRSSSKPATQPSDPAAASGSESVTASTSELVASIDNLDLSEPRAMQDPSQKSTGINVTFHQADALSMSRSDITALLSTSTLITLMFTLNELFSTSLAKTTKFLLNMTDAVSPGTTLLVVDSPGSYSEFEIGKKKSAAGEGEEGEKEKKKYPMKWLLDHTLLETTKASSAESDSRAAWKKIVSDDSRWFRLADPKTSPLDYPIALENMRYQIHMFKRI